MSIIQVISPEPACFTWFHLEIVSNVTTTEKWFKHNEEQRKSPNLCLIAKWLIKWGKQQVNYFVKGHMRPCVCVCLLEQITCTYFLFISVSMDNAVSQDPSSTLTQLHTFTHLEAALYTRSGLYSRVGQRVLLRSTWAVVMYKLQYCVLCVSMIKNTADCQVNLCVCAELKLPCRHKQWDINTG